MDSSMELQSEKYELLQESDRSDAEDIQPYRPQLYSRSSSQRLLKFCGGLFLAFSVVLNVFLVTSNYQNTKQQVGTKWAHLVYDVPTPIYSSTEYGPAIGTEAERDRRWAALDISEGIIALPDKVALEYGLPLSERFPWDQSQGVYLLGAHHQVHCLKRIYEFVSTTHQGRIPMLSYEHIVHCLDNLLQDAWCHADDTPWMQLPPQPYRQRYDEYQTRQCKSWDKLKAWAGQYNACYQNENITDINGLPTDDAFEHFKYCPRGSPYIPKMKQFFVQKARGVNATEAFERIHGHTQ